MFNLLLNKNIGRKQRRTAARESNVCTFESVSAENLWEERNQLFSSIKLLDHLFTLSPQLFNICVDFTSCAEIIEALDKRCEGSGKILKKLLLFSKDKVLENHYLSASLLLTLKFGSVENYSKLIEKVHYYISYSQFVYEKAFVLILKNGIKYYKMSSTNMTTQWDAFIPQNSCAYNDNQYAIELPVGKIIKRQVKEEERRKCEEAVRGILLMVDTFFDIYKKSAFRAAIEEPAQSYFDRFGEDKDRILSRFRSLQVYSFLMNKKNWIRPGMRTSVMTSMHEDCIDILAGLPHGACGLFQAYLNLINKQNWFGPEMRMSLMTNKELIHEDCIDILAGLPHGHGSLGLLKGKTNSCFDDKDVKDSEKNGILENNNQEKYINFHEVAGSMSDPRFLLDANKFSFFFRKNVLVKRMYEFLKKHEIFRKYCNDLYPLFREEHGFHENTIFDFLYDKGSKDLNIDKAARFFWFCGVIHERDAQITWNTAPKSCSQSKHVQDCRKNLERCNFVKEKIIYPDQESVAFNIKCQTSVLHKKRIQISKCAKAG